METWEIVCVDTKAKMRIREENKIYEGVRWLMKAENSDPNQFIGWAWKDQFISNERLARLGVCPKPGEKVTLYFDRSGSICKVDVLPAADAA